MTIAIKRNLFMASLQLKFIHALYPHPE